LATKKISPAQTSFEIKYNDTPAPQIGDWMLTPYGPGQVEQVLEPRPIPEKFLELKQKFNPGQTHWWVVPGKPDASGIDMCDEEGYPMKDLEFIVAVRFRSASWNYFRLSQLTKWNGKHEYNEGPIE
jgi:hypothetical protein